MWLRRATGPRASLLRTVRLMLWGTRDDGAPLLCTLRFPPDPYLVHLKTAEKIWLVFPSLPFFHVLHLCCCRLTGAAASGCKGKVSSKQMVEEEPSQQCRSGTERGRGPAGPSPAAVGCCSCCHSRGQFCTTLVQGKILTLSFLVPGVLLGVKSGSSGEQRRPEVLTVLPFLCFCFGLGIFGLASASFFLACFLFPKSFSWHDQETPRLRCFTGLVAVMCF